MADPKFYLTLNLKDLSPSELIHATILLICESGGFSSNGIYPIEIIFDISRCSEKMLWDNRMVTNVKKLLSERQLELEKITSNLNDFKSNEYVEETQNALLQNFLQQLSSILSVHESILKHDFLDEPQYWTLRQIVKERIQVLESKIRQVKSFLGAKESNYDSSEHDTSIDSKCKKGNLVSNSNITAGASPAQNLVKAKQNIELACVCRMFNCRST